MADLHIREIEPPTLLRDAKVFAASKGWTLKKVVCDAVREYLERKGIHERPHTEGQRADA